MQGLIVKEACPVGSYPATTEVAVHLPQEGLVAHVYQVMVDPSVSIAAMKGAQSGPATMEDDALKRPASHSSTVSVSVDGRANDVSTTSQPLTLQSPYALWQTVLPKLKMVFVTNNVIHCLVTGTAVTAL